MKFNEVKRVVEAILFAAGEPLSVKDIIKIIDEVDIDTKQIAKSIEALQLEYENSKRAFTIRKVANGWQFVTVDAVKPWMRKLFAKRQNQSLSQRALETLAIVAYNQPITKAEIEEIRGVNSDGIVRTLIEKDLITVTGRQKSPGNPMLYGTTKRFLQHFGINSTKDLPNLKEIDELLKTDESFFQEVKEKMSPQELGINFDLDENEIKH
ncbi:MAG: SMC-Scp complex subunit ScpB [Calditrichaeota bacterium]|nr:SMC-Scp complex subunit ScpB [Calditrichota bacterium]